MPVEENGHARSPGRESRTCGPDHGLKSRRRKPGKEEKRVSRTPEKVGRGEATVGVPHLESGKYDPRNRKKTL